MDVPNIYPEEPVWPVEGYGEQFEAKPKRVFHRWDRGVLPPLEIVKAIGVHDIPVATGCCRSDEC